MVISLQAKKVNCRMEYGPMHPPVSQKIHWQPELPVRHFNYTPRMQHIHGDGALVNRKSSSVVTPLPPAFVGAPLERPSIQTELAVSGILRTAVAPFERVKLLMQNQNEMIKSGRLTQPYNGIFDCFARTIRNEGIRSLWRGNIATATAHVSAKAIQFKIQEYFRSHADSRWSTFQIVSAVVLSSAVNLFLVYPFLYAGTRMANDVKTTGDLSKRQFNGILDVYRKTLKVDGIAGLFRGYTMALAQLGMVTVLSAPLKPWHQSLLNQTQVSEIFPFILASYPLDTVTRRMMMNKYKSSRNAFAQIFKTEGFKSFYKGAGASILVSAVFNVSAVSLFHLYDVYHAAMANRGDGSQPGFAISFRYKRDGDK
ncbi:Mitochondrial substrate/solute carrier - like 10 [Theobroma cacao]|nr:Mitochondrial substrate/solute carrier - like 10 [Theobroma cacao]